MPLFDKMLEAKMISPPDLKYVLLTDSMEEALEHIKQVAWKKYEQRRKETFHRSIVLGEK